MGESDAKSLVRFAIWVRAGVLRYLSPGAQAVLNSLVAHTNKQGIAYPKVFTIAFESGRKVQNVYAWLREIEALGLYSRAGRVSMGKDKSIPGPFQYLIADLDGPALRKILDGRQEYKPRHLGRVANLKPRKPKRKAPEVSLSGTSSEVSVSRITSEVSLSGTSGPPTDTPQLGATDTPQLGNLDTPLSDTQKGLVLKGKDKGNTLTSDSLSRSKTESEEKTRAKQREQLVEYFEREKRNGTKREPLSRYLPWLPGYNPEDITAAYRRVFKRKG